MPTWPSRATPAIRLLRSVATRCLLCNVRSEEMISREYATFHRALGEFDSKSPNLSQLRRAITDLFQ